MRKTEFERFCVGKMKGFVDEIWKKTKSVRAAEDFFKIETECWERGGTEFGGSALKAMLEALEAVVGSIEKRKDKMNYPERIRAKRAIGSGKVESACKEILNKRIKQGRRWRLRNGMAIANLRAAWMSGDWSVFYKRYLNAA